MPSDGNDPPSDLSIGCGAVILTELLPSITVTSPPGKVTSSPGKTSTTVPGL